MVAFYEAYSSSEFQQIAAKLKLGRFVQKTSGQIVQPLAAQLESTVIVQPMVGQIVQAVPAQLPNFLELTTLSNHFEILNVCKSIRRSGLKRAFWLT